MILSLFVGGRVFVIFVILLQLFFTKYRWKPNNKSRENEKLIAADLNVSFSVHFHLIYMENRKNIS